VSLGFDWSAYLGSVVGSIVHLDQGYMFCIAEVFGIGIRMKLC
jgi:hypothetical protein